MSSLKDLMNVDVEPLQAYNKRAKEASQHPAPLPSTDPPSNDASLSLEDTKGKALVRRRRSSRVSKPGGPSPKSQPTSSLERRSSAAAAEAMDFTSGYQAGGSNQASMAGGSPQQTSSRGSEPAGDVPVKYTPVTGRISRAKKGVPVHTCDLCRPVKTFTRAEHLRRHQLSHQKPAYPCTFRGCERAFHRPDLLARHVLRHETQGDKAYKSPALGQRPSPSPGPSRGRTPPLKVETPSQPQTQTQGESSTANQSSPTDSDITPRTSTGEAGGMTAFAGGAGTFQDVNYSPATPSHKRTAEEAQLTGTDPYSAISPSSSGPPANYMQNFSPDSGSDLGSQGHYGRPSQNFSILYGDNATAFTNFTTPQQARPTLSIPAEGFYPGLSHTPQDSSWCSSASDSTYSTQSEGSRSGHWSGRGRSGSVAHEWPAGIHQYGILGTPQDIRGSQFDSSMLDQYETPPQMTPPMPSRQLLDVPNNNYVGYYIEPVVGTPALSTYNKPLAQLFSASSTRVSGAGLGSLDGQQKMEPSQQLGALSLTSTMMNSYPQISSHQDTYIASYWKSFNQLYPIVHRGTFDPAANDLLTSSMAAIGTQYHDSAEARREGMELNEFCKKSIDLFPNWSLHTMQAIVLTEVFARWRGRKTTVRFSKQFEELYRRCLTNPVQSQSPFATHTSILGSAVDSLDGYTSHPSTTQQRLPTQDPRREWMEWTECESRRRLLCFCFVFDVCQSIFQEQSRSKAHLEERNSHMYRPCADNLWSATDAAQWKLQQNGNHLQGHSLDLIEQDLSGQYSISRTYFSQVIHICSLARQLPPRHDRYPNDYHHEQLPPGVSNLSNIYPNSSLVHSFLSLHYTPLHDLLAIAGDTWVFARKITPPAAFHAAQSRLKTWSSTLAAAAATNHACHFLTTALSQPYTPSNADQVQSFNGDPVCISNYWALYTCALICWAFGHHRQQLYPSVSRSSSATALNTTEMEVDSPDAPDTPVVDEDRLKALTYINGMMALDTEELLTSKAHMRGDTAGVIDSVRLRLEQIGVGDRCMNIVDATGVLKKLNAGARARFF